MSISLSLTLIFVWRARTRPPYSFHFLFPENLRKRSFKSCSKRQKQDLKIFLRARDDNTIKTQSRSQNNVGHFSITMKFQLAVLASVALLPQASAFTPAALSASKFKYKASAIDDGEYLGDEGGNDAWSKLTKMRDFDPDEEDDEELVREVLDATAAVLELEEVDGKDSSSSFGSALNLVRLLRDQVEKKKSLDFTTYSNHDEVSYFYM